MFNSKSRIVTGFESGRNRRKAAMPPRLQGVETLEQRVLLAVDSALDPQALLDQYLGAFGGGHDDTSPGFGRKIAGTYFGVAVVETIENPVVDILTFHADGTLSGTATDDYGVGDIAASGFNSPEHGVWERTGQREISTTTLSFGYDSNGALENIFRISSESTFSKDFTSITGTIVLDVFLANQNPLTDDPIASLPGEYNVDRLHVVTSTDTGGSGHRGAVPPGFGQHVAGTFFGTAEVATIEDQIVDILTFNADGTLTGTATDDYGFGDIAASGFNSPEHGVWERTGQHEISTTTLSFAYDANGALENIFRISSESTFSKDFESVAGTIVLDVFLANQNPLTDDPVASIPGEYAVDRLHVVSPTEDTGSGQKAVVPPGFGRHLAGTFFGVAEVATIEEQIVDILTFNADGTLIGTATDDFGFADIAASGFNSPEHGVWERTGQGAISTTTLSFAYDANGLLENIFRISSESTPSKDFETVAGTIVLDVFLAEQNPLTDDPVASIPGEYAVDRLGVTRIAPAAAMAEPLRAVLDRPMEVNAGALRALRDEVLRSYDGLADVQRDRVAIPIAPTGSAGGQRVYPEALLRPSRAAPRDAIHDVIDDLAVGRQVDEVIEELELVDLVIAGE